MTAAPAESMEAEMPECLIGPSVVTDGAARALVLYQRLIQTGFGLAATLTGA